VGGVLDDAWRLIDDGQYAEAERALLEGESVAAMPYRTPGPEPGAVAHALGVRQAV